MRSALFLLVIGILVPCYSVSSESLYLGLRGGSQAWNAGVFDTYSKGNFSRAIVTSVFSSNFLIQEFDPSTKSLNQVGAGATYTTGDWSFSYYGHFGFADASISSSILFAQSEGTRQILTRIPYDLNARYHRSEHELHAARSIGSGFFVFFGIKAIQFQIHASNDLAWGNGLQYDRESTSILEEYTYSAIPVKANFGMEMTTSGPLAGLSYAITPGDYDALTFSIGFMKLRGTQSLDNRIQAQIEFSPNLFSRSSNKIFYSTRERNWIDINGGLIDVTYSYSVSDALLIRISARYQQYIQTTRKNDSSILQLSQLDGLAPTVLALNLSTSDGSNVQDSYSGITISILRRIF
ncbi:MAG: hypothetical protein CMF59_08435 [Leptospiraceae bacterium]|nr:hypothetical protein [Leptospiraceae bacterium]